LPGAAVAEDLASDLSGASSDASMRFLEIGLAIGAIATAVFIGLLR
jgi:hypothetical protein